MPVVGCSEMLMGNVLCCGRVNKDAPLKVLFTKKPSEPVSLQVKISCRVLKHEKFQSLAR